MNVKHFSSSELAERWGVTEDCLQRWRSAGIGPVYLKLGGRVVYRIEDIEAYEDECARASTAQRAVAGGAA